MKTIEEYGIQLRSKSVGNHKTLCPECSHTRRNKKEPCLSVNIQADGGAVWMCHHCEWKGGIGNTDTYREYKRPYKRPEKPKGATRDDKVAQWFKGRGISESTLEAVGVYSAARDWYVNNSSEKKITICFPYFKDGELVNIKYRTKDKDFRQEADAERSLYNNDIARAGAEDKGFLIFVEGEMDVLSFYEAGLDNVVSLPDGAPKEAKFNEDDKRFEALKAAEWLDNVDKIILAVDADDAGQALQRELIHRFGKDRCWTVEWPCLGDVQIKDANDCLVTHGAEVLVEIIEHATPQPVDGLYSINDYQKEVFDIYRGNIQRPVSTGFANLDEFYQVMPSTFALVTGIPNHGKSNFIDQMIVNLNQNHGWKFAIFSPEHSTANHIRRLAEKVIKKPFDIGPNPRMTEEDLTNALVALDGNFHFIESEENIPNIKWLLQKAKTACQRFGVKGIVIDPYNEIDATRGATKREDEHIRDLISRCKAFCRSHNVAMWMVAHPAKMQRQADGSYPPPSLYDVSGSAHWNNMADVGMVVHRDFDLDHTRVIIRKIREQGLYGSIGEAFFRYNVSTHCYQPEIQTSQPVGYYGEDI